VYACGFNCESQKTFVVYYHILIFCLIRFVVYYYILIANHTRHFCMSLSVCVPCHLFPSEGRRRTESMSGICLGMCSGRFFLFLSFYLYCVSFFFFIVFIYSLPPLPSSLYPSSLRLHSLPPPLCLYYSACADHTSVKENERALKCLHIVESQRALKSPHIVGVTICGDLIWRASALSKVRIS